MAAQSATQQQPASPVSSTAPAPTEESATATAAAGTHSKDASTASPTAASGSANNKKTPSSRPSSLTKTSPSPIARKAKTSFWQSLISVLIPCGSHKSTSRAHDVDVDVPQPKPKADKEKATAADAAADVTAEKDTMEKTAAGSSTAPEAATTKSAAPTTNGDAAAVSSPESSSTPSKPKVVVPPSLTVPPAITTSTPVEQDGDVAVVVPPSPHSHLLPREETEGVTSGAVQAPGSTGGESRLVPPPLTAGSGGTITSSDYSSEDATFTTDVDENENGEHDANIPGELEIEDPDDDEERLIMQGGTGIPIGPDGKPQPLLPPVSAAHKGRKCLVLDLDETLLHSSFKLIPQADYVVPVEIEWQWHNVYVIKRPGVDNFLKKMGEIYEVVIFTASLSKYADPVLDRLDVNKVVAHRLFRESCYNHKGNYVKDLSRLGRPIEDTIILDNSPASYIFHPNNAVPVSSWFNDPHDTELTDLCPFLTDLMTVEDVRGVLDGGL